MTTGPHSDQAAVQSDWPGLKASLGSFDKGGEVKSLNQKLSNDSAKRRAFQNIMKSIDLAAELPGQVFKAGMSNFHCFAAESVVSQSFVEIIQDMMRVEGAAVTSCMNLTRSERMEFDEIEVTYIDKNTKGIDYFNFLLQNQNNEFGWMVTMDRHVFASDVGEWCIYAERANEVAVIAFNVIDIERYIPHLDRLDAHNIFELIYSDKGYYPYDKLVEEWKVDLCKYYII